MTHEDTARRDANTTPTATGEVQRPSINPEVAQWHARLHREAHRDDIERSIGWIAQTVFIIAAVVTAALFAIWIFGT